MQRLADRIKQHVPTSIRKESSTVREQPPRMCENISSKINCESAIDNISLQIQNAPKHILTIIFRLLVKPDRHFI